MHEKCPYSELFWTVFSRIRTEYGKIRTGITANTDTFNAVNCAISKNLNIYRGTRKQIIYAKKYWTSIFFLYAISKRCSWHSSLIDITFIAAICFCMVTIVSRVFLLLLFQCGIIFCTIWFDLVTCCFSESVPFRYKSRREVVILV